MRKEGGRRKGRDREARKKGRKVRKGGDLLSQREIAHFKYIEI